MTSRTPINSHRRSFLTIALLALCCWAVALRRDLSAESHMASSVESERAAEPAGERASGDVSQSPQSNVAPLASGSEDPQPKTGAGELHGPFALASQIYGGTTRDYWVHVPPGYDPKKYACVMIVQDGKTQADRWRLSEAIDEAVVAGSIPVTIGVYVDPGVWENTGGKSVFRENRSVEYDSLGDTYARFLVEELLAAVGKEYSISNDPNSIALLGAGSGAVAAFNAAWEKPESFRRVWCDRGAFVNLRGASDLPTLIRKYEPKPLRVYLQGDSSERSAFAGDTWLSNQAMLSALEWAGYDVSHQWQAEKQSTDLTEPDSAKRRTEATVQVLNWLWRDYPNPISVPSNRPTEFQKNSVTLADSAWQQVSSGHEFAEAPAVNLLGQLFFADSRAGRIYRVGEDGKTRIFKDQAGRITSMSFAPGGSLLAIKDGKQIVRFNENAEESIMLNDIRCQKIVALPTVFYYTDDATPTLRWCDYSASELGSTTLMKPSVAIFPSANHRYLNSLPEGSQATIQYQIGETGNLSNRQTFGYLHLPYMETGSGASAVVVDEAGQTYVATSLGIQILDAYGRVVSIISRPGKARITGMAFGGALRDTLIVTAGESVYARKVSSRGILSFESKSNTPTEEKTTPADLN